MQMQNRLAIVIPTYNEKQNIQKLIPALLERYPAAKIFVVDDNSPDGTAEVVQRYGSQFENVRLIFRHQKEGLASAYLDAFARLVASETIEFILTMDGDLSHSPDDIAKLLPHAADYDLVIGSRYVAGGLIENWNFWRRQISKYANWYARIITGVPIYDLTAGFVIYRKDLLARVLQEMIRSDAYGYQIEMKYLASKAGAKIKEVPITFRERMDGASKLDGRTVWEGIIVPWHLRLFR